MAVAKSYCQTPWRGVKMNRNKMLFALPNLFTLTSIAFGFYAIITAANAADPAGFKKAAIAIIFGFICDGLDGRVARLTKTQSAFGVQLDSLADVVTFGVAPAVLVYQWSLAQLGMVGLAGAIIFVICGALRLARFNVMTERHKGVMKFFTGLPIPSAAGMITAIVLMVTSLGDFTLEPLSVLVITAVLSYLMVSNIRYHTFKALKRDTPTMLKAMVIGFAVAFAGVKAGLPVMLFLVGTTYISLGLLEEVVFFRKRRREEREMEAEEEEPA
jgi:CDP-diacylglycerol--serine O-phosphatidyltransferase